MADSLDELVEELPDNAMIKDAKYEASDIVFYTGNREFFLDNDDIIRDMVSRVKKRIEVRPDPGITTDQDAAEEEIREIVPDEAGVDRIIFEEPFGKVIIRAEKPGLVIGKNGSTLDDIKQETYWMPVVERIPAIDSKIVDRAREIMTEGVDFRKDFLHGVGKKIELEKDVGDEWIRVEGLGGFRQVGRSCVLVQTEESSVLMDCGVDTSRTGRDSFPHLDVPELDLQDLDAVIVSHAHMDHCLTPDTPVTMANGLRKPLEEIEAGDAVKTVNWDTGEIYEGTVQKRKDVDDDTYLEIRTPYNTVHASEDHRFFTVEGLEIVEKEAGELEERMLIPRRTIDRPETKDVQLDIPEYRERISLSHPAKQELRDTRKTAGLSRQDVVERLEKGTNFVYNLEEKYESIYRDNLDRLLDLYGLDREAFYRKHNLGSTQFPEMFDEQLAQIVGYFFGDGHRAEENRLRFTDKNRECLERYRDLIEAVFNHRGVINHHTDQSKNAYQLEINNAGIVRFLERNFAGIYERSQDASIPPAIRYGSREVVAGFLRGMMDAEGDVEDSVRISAGTARVRKQLQSLLSSIGVPAPISSTDRRLTIQSGKGINRFDERIGADHPRKEKRIRQLAELTDKDDRTGELLPVTSNDLERILDEAGMLGRVNKSPRVKDLPTCLVDWYRRGERSYASRETVEDLVHVLEERVDTLGPVDVERLSEARRTVSLPYDGIVAGTEASRMQVQLREEKAMEDRIATQVQTYVQDYVDTCLQQTQQNLQRLKTLLAMDVEWQPINSITEKENEYGYLVDISVGPNQNFIAEDTVVHNCGLVPYLYDYGYDGPVYCTEPTRDMMVLLQLDYLDVARKEGGKAPYDSSAIKEEVKRTITVDYGEVTDITPDMRLTFNNAGHILGSASVHLHIGEGLHNIVYSGDIKYDQTKLLRPADPKFNRVETLILESTYGGKKDKMPRREKSNKKFVKKVKETLQNGGKVMLPVFAIGRSQEIMMILAEEADKDWFDYPVYLDGMIWDATALHTAYPEFLSKDIQNKIFHQEENPFLIDNFHRIGSHSEREDVFDEGPCVILATSGMMTGGPILSYVDNLAEERDNRLIFVGYQAPGSLGNRIQSGERTVELPSGKEVDINMDVDTVSGFSAHSDRQQLINYVGNLPNKPQKIITNHGEKSVSFDLSSSLHKIYNVDTEAPPNLESVRLN